MGKKLTKKEIDFLCELDSYLEAMRSVNKIPSGINLFPNQKLLWDSYKTKMDLKDDIYKGIEIRI